MRAHVDSHKQSESGTAQNPHVDRQSTPSFKDQPQGPFPVSKPQAQLQNMIASSPQVRQLKSFSQIANAVTRTRAPYTPLPLENPSPVVQRMPVIQRKGEGDKWQGEAQGFHDEAIQKINALQFDEAWAAYTKLKAKAIEINEGKALSTAEVFRKHTDKATELIHAVIKRFREAAQPILDELAVKLALLNTNTKKDSEAAFEGFMGNVAKGDKGLAANHKKTVVALQEAYAKATKGLSDEYAGVIGFNTKIKKDADLKYILRKGNRDKGGDRDDDYSTLSNTKVELSEEVLAPAKSAVKGIHEDLGGLKNQAGKIDIPQEGEIGPDLKLIALKALAGSPERQSAIASLVEDNIPKQLAIYSTINKNHKTEDIAQVVTYITDMGVDNLDIALQIVVQVGAKGTIPQINAYQKAAKATKGSPEFLAVSGFLTDLLYPTIDKPTGFLTVLGVKETLDTAKLLWNSAQTSNRTADLLALYQEGTLPQPCVASTTVIATAFISRKGKSTLQDWKALLAVPGWSVEEVLALANAFDADPGGASSADWVKTAKADDTLKTKPDEVRATSRLGTFANDDWYDKYDLKGLSSGKEARKKYTQLLYAMLGKENLDSLPDFDVSAMRGDFLSMVLFFHKHIAAFKSDPSSGQGFDRGGEAEGTYARSDKTHPLNVKYKLLLEQLKAGSMPDLLQPLNPALTGLQGSPITEDTEQGVGYQEGTVGVASAGLPSHNLKNLGQQQLIASKLPKKDKDKTAKSLFETTPLEKGTKASRELSDKSAVTDELVNKLKTSMTGAVAMDVSYTSFHDHLLTNRAATVSALGAVINTISGGSKNVYAISSEGLPSLVLLVPKGSSGSKVSYGGTDYANTEKLLPALVTDFNGASGQEIKITQRGSFGFQRPTVTDTADSIRIWPGYTPVELLIPGLKAVISKMRNKGGSETLGKIDDLDNVKTDLTKPVLHMESLKAAMRHALIALESKVDVGASAEKKRVYEWLKTRLIIKLKQAGILLAKGSTIFDTGSLASASEKGKHFQITADMTDKLQEYTMLFTGATLPDTVNPNASHTTPGKFKDSTDAYEKKVVSKLAATDYRIYYLDSGEQALITAGILANRFEKDKDETGTNRNVAKSKYQSLNPYFEVGIFGGDTRSNLEKDASGKIIHADMAPVITGGRTTSKPQSEIQSEFKATWQNIDGSVKDTTIIPIIDITNTGIDAVTGLGNMPDNFIIVESLTKHAQLGADKYIMGRLIAVSKTKGGTVSLSKSNFLDLSQKIVGPVANAAYNPLLSKIRSNMDKALYSGDVT